MDYAVVKEFCKITLLIGVNVILGLGILYIIIAMIKSIIDSLFHK